MKVRGVVNYEGKIIEITEDNLFQVYFLRTESDTTIIITLIVDGLELTFNQDSIHELKFVQISDSIQHKLKVLESEIDGCTNV